MLLRERTAVVYGGGGAVGAAVAKAFAREGARVFLGGRTRATLETVADAIVASGGRADVMPVDATDHAAVEAHLGAVAAKGGPVKVMFNAVGLDDTQGAPLVDMPRDRFLAPVVTAMKTWFSTGTIMARHMAENGGGVILGIRPMPPARLSPMSGASASPPARSSTSSGTWRRRMGAMASACAVSARPARRIRRGCAVSSRGSRRWRGSVSRSSNAARARDRRCCTSRASPKSPTRRCCSHRTTPAP